MSDAGMTEKQLTRMEEFCIDNEGLDIESCFMLLAEVRRLRRENEELKQYVKHLEEETEELDHHAVSKVIRHRKAGNVEPGG